MRSSPTSSSLPPVLLFLSFLTHLETCTEFVLVSSADYDVDMQLESMLNNMIQQAGDNEEEEEDDEGLIMQGQE